MHIVRVDFKNGLHLEFNYENPDAAEAAAKGYDVAKFDGAADWVIEDEVARRSSVVVAEVSHVQIVDLEREIRMGTTLAIQVDNWKREAMQDHQQKLIATRPMLLSPNGAPIPPLSRLGGLQKN